MYIKKIELQHFRAFDDPTYIDLGQGMTCIAGLNGTGKSTVLAALGNCGELKASEGKHLNGSRFRAAYSDLIRKDRGDTSGLKVRLFFASSDSEEKLQVESLRFRATTQSDHDRYRLIPVKQEQGHERKLSWPTYYLGLSRLYPVGESDSAKTSSITLSEDEKNEFVETYKTILSTQDDLAGSSVIKFSDAKKKIGAAVSTDRYGDMANSAGQDNLGQILLTILSFERLKEERGEKYNGGLFLIDELDATLHPAAQNKLYKYLTKKAKRLGLQIVFTSHSLSLLEYMHEVASLSPDNKFSRLLYFTRDRGKVEVEVNPSMKAVRSGLRVSMAKVENDLKVPLLTEDPVAAKFIQWMISEFYTGVHLQESQASMSFEQMAKLVKSFPSFFFDSLIVFDADVKQPNNKRIVDLQLQGTYFVEGEPPRLGEEAYRRIFFLPGGAPVETMMWQMISNLAVDDDFFLDDQVRRLSVSKQTLIVEYESEFRSNLQGQFKELELHKEWFRHSTVALLHSKIYSRWLQEHREEVEAWVKALVEEYKKIGKRLDIFFVPPANRGE